MKWLIFLVFSHPVFASYCTCEFYIKSPLHGKTHNFQKKIYEFVGNYYGETKALYVHECRSQCQLVAMGKISDEDLAFDLNILTEKMLREESIGYNCTGPTTFKFPVEMRAYIGKTSLGPVYQSMEIVHKEKRCF